jgi:hypothetical protein
MRVKPTGVGANRVCWLAELCDANSEHSKHVGSHDSDIAGLWRLTGAYRIGFIARVNESKIWIISLLGPEADCTTMLRNVGNYKSA